MAEVSTTGTGPIAQTGKTPGDILMENLLNSVISPVANSLLDVSATTTKTGTETKASSTSTGAQAKIDEQIAALEASLASGNSQYEDLIGNILNNAAQTFNPTNARSRQSGAYNSTTLEMLRNDAEARATAQGAEAVLADKKAKQQQLLDLIKTNAVTNATDKVTYDTAQEAGASQVGKGVGGAAAVGGAALLAGQLLNTSAGKNMTQTGINALKKLWDLSGNSTGLPANWFTDLSGSMGTAAADDIIAELGLQAADQAAMEDAMTNVFGSSEGASSWLTDSGVSSDMLSSGATTAGGFTALVNAADGEWGWNDTGSTVGSAIGTAIGGPVGGAIGSTVGSVGGEAVGEDVESGNAFLNTSTIGLGGYIEDGVEAVGGFWDDMFGGIDDGCFITTAVMKAQGREFRDDCEELTLLREVRDQYIKNLPNGPQLLEAYRTFAPEYVKRLEASDQADKHWADLYHWYITPAVKHAAAGHHKKAYLVYLLMLQYVQEITGIGA